MSNPLVIDEVDPEDSIFSQQFGNASQPNASAQFTPWWQNNFLLQQPRFVNAWNAVFPTVIVNIFGIVIFLRMGWIVGTSGVLQSLVIVALCTIFSAITVLSAIGICERCKIRQGGIYFIIAHVLGKRVGGAIGIIYTFGQAVATSLVALGFGESMGRLILGSFSQLTAKVLAVLVILILNGLNFAGLRFIIRLQMLLMCFLGAAILDFLLGALFSSDPEHGVGSLSGARLAINWHSHYAPNNCSLVSVTEYHVSGTADDADGLVRTDMLVATAAPMPDDGAGGAVRVESFFSVFGVFFANFIGVLAGVNMGTDLQDPIRDIARGELSALGVSCALCSLFVLVLGAGVERGALLCDLMISERVAWTKIIFLGGLYVACLSSILSSTLGTSRVVQGIAAEGLVPVLNSFAEEERDSSTDKNPLKSTVLVTVVSVLFIFLGNLNQLAILSSIPFLVTYAFVNYAYVSLAMSADLNALNDEIASKSNYGSMHDFAKTQAGVPAASNAPTVRETPRETLQKLFGGEGGADSSGAHAAAGAPSLGEAWYSKCINRYVSFVAAIVHILAVVFINQWFALLHLIAFAILYVTIGQNTSPAFEQGVSQFSIVHMLRVALRRDELDESDARIMSGGNRAVIPPMDGPATGGTARFETAQLNDPNADYSLRKQYHHAEQIASGGDAAPPAGNYAPSSAQ